MALNDPILDWAGRRVWLVGASSGIGAALARALAPRGARLALSARRSDRLAALAEECAGLGSPQARVVAVDLTHGGDCERARDELLQQWGGLDLVVLASGIWHPLHAWQLSPGMAQARATVETNLLGVMNGTAAVLPALLGQGHGALAIVASVAGYGGLPRALAYGSSKAGLINFAESLYLDLAPRGISVFLVCPGFVETPLTARNDFRMPALISAERAAEEILDGFGRGEFEIHFPKRFTRLLKLLRLLPYRAYFAVVRRITEAV